MDTQVKYAVWFEWTDTPPEWLCDRDGVVFTFDFRDEANAMAVLLHPGDGIVVEAREYDGELPTRPYPWDESQVTLEELKELTVSVV